MKENKIRNSAAQQAASSRLAMILVVLVLFIYFVVQVISAFSGSIRTVDATHVTVNDSFNTTGWLFRDETIIDSAVSDTVQHIVSSGERVQQNAALAVVYQDEAALQVSRDIETYNEQIALLQSAIQSSGDDSDSAKMDQQITLLLQQLDGDMADGTGSALESQTNSLRALSLRRDAKTLDTDSLQNRITDLTNERELLNLQLAGKSSQIEASTSGYFSEIVDGYESILTLDALQELDTVRFAELIGTKPQISEQASLGKIIKGFCWYVAAEIPLEQANRMTVSENIEVRFTQASIQVPVSVYAISKTETEDSAIVVLEGDEFNSELVSMREQPIEIILGTFTGIKIPNKAIRMETGSDGQSQTGVYILSGSVTKFKTIKKLFETDSFCVVQQTATDVNGVVALDKIVVSGKGLQNNMVIKT